MLVIYVNYGKGMQFRTGPIKARFRRGPWAHYYKRMHSKCKGCLRCFERTGLRPIKEIPAGCRPGVMYSIQGDVKSLP